MLIKTAEFGRSPTDYLFDVNDPDYSTKEVGAQLKAFGFAAIRNLFPAKMIANIDSRAESILERPSIGGSVGYYQKDGAKKTYDALLMGGPTVDLITDERVIDIAENYLGSESLLSEVFLKHDLGTNVYFPVHRDFEPGRVMTENVTLTQEIMDQPFSAGSVVYLQDSAESAFCYSAGTHNMPSENGASPGDYPDNMRQEILDSTIRVEGKAGDLVIFDDRGFHGPFQPTKVDRRIIIWDHFRRDVFANATKWPLPVLPNDLGHLNKRQIRFLGLGAETMRSHEQHHIRFFNTHNRYPMLSRIFEGVFALERMKRRIRNRLKGHTASFLPPDL